MNRRRAAAVCAAWVTAVLLAGCGSGASPDESTVPADVAPGAQDVPRVPPSQSGAPPPEVIPAEPGARIATTDLRPAPIGARAGAVAEAAPIEVRVPAVDIGSVLVELGLTDDGAVAPPEDPATAGWFVGSTQPGQVGPAVIAAHVDSSSGPAAFYRLGDVSIGDDIEVARADGSLLTFRVTAREQYPKDSFPTAAVYGPTPGPTLRLITCGGSFDRATGHYRDNIVVYAELI